MVSDEHQEPEEPGGAGSRGGQWVATHLELSQLLLQRSVLGLHRLQLRLQVLHLVRIGGIQVLLDEAVPAQRPALAAPSAAGGGGRGALQGIRRLLAGLVQRHQHCAAAPHPRQQRNTRDSAGREHRSGGRTAAHPSSGHRSRPPARGTSGTPPSSTRSSGPTARAAERLGKWPGAGGVCGRRGAGAVMGAVIVPANAQLAT